MNIIKIKGVCCVILIVTILTSAIVYFYDLGSATMMGIMKGDDYIYYDWKQVPLFLFIPVMVFFDLFIVCLAIRPGRKKIVLIMQKLMIPVTVYSIAAFVIGIILSMVISVYPLGTNYYKCKATSIVSSGSHYAKSKEICKQMAYSSGSKSETRK